MNIVSMILGLVFVCMFLAQLGGWLMRQPMFALSAIRVEGDLTHNNVATLRANVAAKLQGNFLTVDLDTVRVAFEAAPWVRRAMVQREFPNRLKVVLYEHQPIALWGAEGDGKLINSVGEIFDANPSDPEIEELPLLNGPQDKAPLVLKAYQQLSSLFEEMNATLDLLELSGQGRWSAGLDSGATIELGHGSLDDLQKRTSRFVRTAAQISSRFGRELESADLRYGNGYALRLKGVTTGESADINKNAPQKKR